MERFRKRQAAFSGLYLIIACGLMLLLHGLVLARMAPTTVPYSEFLDLLRQGRLDRVDLRQDEIVAAVRPGPEDRGRIVRTGRLPGIDETDLVEELEQRKVVFAGRIESTPFWERLLFSWVLPLGLLVAFYAWTMRRLGRGGPLSFGKSHVKIYDQNESDRVTFADVAGADGAKAELVEVVDFLRQPKKYEALGARIPKGVLLVGPPGTGKTLLARAVAGEAGVPFFSMSGSGFVEMFVGVGAARMRDLFQQAKERAPCIVFIDELDAIGKSRGGTLAFATHDEREQTLNQLLVEMDGFDPRGGVLIMAATNRPEVLDRALLRPGRFDRQILVDRPDMAGREAILRVHARRLRLGEDVDLRTIARRTPGLAGADLANVVNEAALAAARRGSEAVRSRDFDEAVDRIQLGLRTGRIMTQEEKRRVAFHEAGHALVALSLEHVDPVHRVTIIPRSVGALGATLQLPAAERHLMTREELRDRLAVLLGGRAAEELRCGSISTGAQNDLERAAETARQMVCRFGMSDELGPLTLGGHAGSPFLEPQLRAGEGRGYSEETARLIDAEVRREVETARERALAVLRARLASLDAIASRLLSKETLEREELEAIARESAGTAGSETEAEAEERGAAA